MKEQQNIIIYNTPDGKAAVSLYAKDGMVWMNQNQLSELFDTSKQNIGQHIASILKDKKLEEASVVKNYFTTASDGKKYDVAFYSLEIVLAIGFRVRSKRGTQFRIWANRNLKEYMVKGFVMDDEGATRLLLKNYLNELEGYSAAVNIGIIDEEVAKKMYGYKLVRHYKELEPYIKRIRTKFNEPSIYCELEQVCERWSTVTSTNKKYGEDQ